MRTKEEKNRPWNSGKESLRIINMDNSTDLFCNRQFRMVLIGWIKSYYVRFENLWIKTRWLSSETCDSPLRPGCPGASFLCYLSLLWEGGEFLVITRSVQSQMRNFITIITWGWRPGNLIYPLITTRWGARPKVIFLDIFSLSILIPSFSG